MGSVFFFILLSQRSSRDIDFQIMIEYERHDLRLFHDFPAICGRHYYYLGIDWGLVNKRQQCFVGVCALGFFGFFTVYDFCIVYF
jgi:hypothetical protein